MRLGARSGELEDWEGGGLTAVLLIAIAAAECGNAVSKETKVDILVTPLVTILTGVALSALIAPAIGTAASSLGASVEWATVLQPFFMGIDHGNEYQRNNGRSERLFKKIIKISIQLLILKWILMKRKMHIVASKKSFE